MQSTFQLLTAYFTILPLFFIFRINYLNSYTHDIYHFVVFYPLANLSRNSSNKFILYFYSNLTIPQQFLNNSSIETHTSSEYHSIDYIINLTTLRHPNQKRSIYRFCFLTSSIYSTIFLYNSFTILPTKKN